MRRFSASVIAVLGLAAASAANPAVASDPPASAARSCGTVDMEFTRARVVAKNLRCSKARALIGAWRDRAPSGRPPPRVTRVQGYRCVFGGSEGLVRLRCSAGSRVATATWGD